MSATFLPPYLEPLLALPERDLLRCLGSCRPCRVTHRRVIDERNRNADKTVSGG